MKFKINLSTILLLGIAIGLNAQSYPPDGWRVDIPLVSASEYQRYSNVAAIDNTIHTIWVDSRDNVPRLYYKKSMDDGFNWSNEVRISLQDEILVNEERNIDIAVRNTYVFVVYAIQTQNGYSVRFCRSTDNGVTWGGYQTIAGSLPRFPQPGITVNRESMLDSLRVVYCEELDIVYVASGNNGESWHSYDHLNFPVQYLLMYPAITTINNRPHIAIGGNCIFAYARHLGNRWELYGWMMNAGESFHYSRIVSHSSGNLCIVFEYKNTVGNTYRSIWRWFSTNNGNSWNGGVIWNPTSPSGPENPDIIVDKENRLLLVYGYYGNGNLYGCFSPDFGATWEEPFLLAGSYNNHPEPPVFAPHPSVDRGSISKHVIFEKWAGGYDLFYIANDDLLISDGNLATAFTNGRHLIRDPLSGKLHLVYFSQGRPHYSWSGDNGQSWAPYHIIENVQVSPVKKDSGYYPSVGLHPGMLTVQHPCVVYIDNEKDVEYRYYDDLGGQWRGFTILSYSQTGLEPGPPSIYTQGNQVYVVFSVVNWDTPQYQFTTAVYFYQFTYNATGPGNPVRIDEALSTALINSRPSIVVDGNGNPHCTWNKIVSGNENIYYRWRNGSTWQPIVLVSNQTPNYVDKSPHIDCYGDSLSVVWYDEISGVPNEILRRKKRISTDRWSAVDPRYSLSPGVRSEFPVNSAHNFSIWCEIGNASNYDIRYRSDTYGFGWVSQAPEKEYFCHSQLQRDYYPWDLYTIFTKGNTTPYQIVCVHQQFGDAPPGTLSSLYTVETGEDSASAFCISRDGIIKYNSCAVDYGVSQITYNLPLLDPTFPLHLIKGKFYFEGTGNKLQEVWINNEKMKTFLVKANESRDFIIPIPRELYQNTHRITLTLKNPQLSGVYLPGLEVYRIPDLKYGGPQSSDNDELVSTNRLVITPVPFSREAKICFRNIRSEKSKLQGNILSLTIYDPSGRVVREFNELVDSPFSQVIWDGTDDSGRQLPSGIYFIELKTDNELITDKIIMLK